MSKRRESEIMRLRLAFQAETAELRTELAKLRNRVTDLEEQLEDIRSGLQNAHEMNAIAIGALSARGGR